MAAPSRKVVIAANSGWNIVNFRAGLIRALQEEGYEPVVVAPADPTVEDWMKALGVERIAVPVDRAGLNPIADLKLLSSYQRILRQVNPVAFLGFTIKPNIYGCMAARLARVPAIANVSGLGTVFIKTGPLLALVTRLYRLALSRAAVVFFQNPDDLELFSKRKMVRRGQARLLPGSGIDLKRFKPAGKPPEQPTFLLIARLLGDKGVREFAEAARIIRTEVPSARFQLLGPLDEGNRTAISRSELNEWVGDGAIDYLGEADDVRPFIAAASAVVLPSYREGLPRTLLEAAAMERPLIATDVPGCREVTIEGETGILCRPRSAASLADAMRMFTHLPLQSRLKMGRAARSLVEDRFSETRVVRAYLDALGEFGRPRS